MELHQGDENLPLPLGLPNWPHCWIAQDRRSCIVTGRYLTPRRARFARFLAFYSTLAVLIFPGWYCWGWKNLPDWLRIMINATAAKWGYHDFSFEQRKWVYVGLWAGCWLFWRLWEWLFYTVYKAALLKRTTIRFTAAEVRLRRLGRKYERAAKISFSARPHPELPWLQLKAQQRGSSSLAVFYQQIRVFAHGVWQNLGAGRLLRRAGRCRPIHRRLPFCQ